MSSPASAAERARAVGEMARARDVSLVPLVGLAHVEQLDRVVREQPLELVERDRLELLASRRLPASPRSRTAPTACSARAARAASSSSVAWRTSGRSGRTNAAFVAKPEPETGMPTAPGWWPAANASVGRTSRTIASSGTELDALERRLRAEELAAVQLDDPLHVRRPRRLRAERGGEEVRELAPAAPG